MIVVFPLLRQYSLLYYIIDIHYITLALDGLNIFYFACKSKIFILFNYSNLAQYYFVSQKKKTVFAIFLNSFRVVFSSLRAHYSL